MNVLGVVDVFTYIVSIQTLKTVQNEYRLQILCLCDASEGEP